MSQIADWDGDWLGWMYAGQMGIGCSGVEVVGDGTPSMVEAKIDGPRSIVGVKDDSSCHDVISRVERIEGGACTIHEPKEVRTFLSIKHASAVGVRVGPICARLILNGVRYTITVKVVGLNIVRGVVLWVGTVKVLASVVHATLVGVIGG